MAMFGVAIAQAGGLLAYRPWLIGLLLALQFGTAIPYAAARVRLARGVEITRTWVYVGNLVALAIVVTLASIGVLRWFAPAAFAVLAGRATWGLSCRRREVRAATVGIQEVVYSAVTVAAIVLSV
jgi:hypothetical protein